LAGDTREKSSSRGIYLDDVLSGTGRWQKGTIGNLLAEED
jgi:hypothetical protein